MASHSLSKPSWFPHPPIHSQVEALTADRVAASMASYSLSIPAAVPSRDMALAEFAWRNSWFISQQRTPAHVAWLARAGLEA